MILIYLLGVVGGLVLLWAIMAYFYLRPVRVKMESFAPGFERVSLDWNGNQSPGYSNFSQLSNPPSATILLVHGYSGSPLDWYQLAQDLTAKGFGVVVPVLPGHVDHPEKLTRFGATETELIAQWGQFCRSRFDGPLIGVGMSMGGAVIWLTSASHPQLFDAICTECAFSSLSEAASDWFRRMFPGAQVFFRPVRTFSQWMGGVRESEIRPIDSATLWKERPAAVIHGTSDRLFPLRHAEQIAEAAGCKVAIFEGAKHGRAYESDPARYMNVLISIIPLPK